MTDVTVTGAAGADASQNGSTGEAGGNGAPGAPADAYASSSDSENSATATGGYGGTGGQGGNGEIDSDGYYSSPGGNGGDGGAGGSALAISDTNSDASSTSATASATGGSNVFAGYFRGASGDAGYGDPNGQGGIAGDGGTATASASDSGGNDAAASAVSIGGDGGTGQTGLGSQGGNGGVARNTSAYASGITQAVVEVGQTGGSGGAGEEGNGGNGASSTLINAVSGETDGGLLYLYQYAFGGNAGGGASGFTSGSAGDAYSSLTFDDTVNSTQSQTLNGESSATGGNGSGDGGGATAFTVLTGINAVNASATSQSGNNSLENSQAIATGTGFSVEVQTIASVEQNNLSSEAISNSTAISVGGVTTSGLAYAYATSENNSDNTQGVLGTTTATAEASVTTGLVGEVFASVTAPSAGSAGAEASIGQASISGNDVYNGQTEIGIVGSPIPNGSDSPLGDAEAAMIGVPVDQQLVLATGIFSSQEPSTIASTSDLKLSLDEVTPSDAGELELALYNVIGSASTVQNFSIAVEENGVDVFDADTSSLADLTTGTPIDLGKISFEDGSAQLDIVTSMQTSALFGFDIGVLDVVACYCRGTHIRIETGSRGIEQLQIGEMVLTINGLKPIKWIGKRSYSARFVHGNTEILPICFKAGSLDNNTPVRDLWVSPHHAMYIDGVLIEARDLVNGISITQARDIEKVEYFHIELASHDVILAEGAWSETYMDDNNRQMFHNAAEYGKLYPSDENLVGRYCAPRIDNGSLVQDIRDRINARADRRLAG